MSSSVCSYWPNVASGLADVQRLQGRKRIKSSLLRLDPKSVYKAGAPRNNLGSELGDRDPR